uniref:Uncharacterized protein n=1 Tax=Ditylenchus dipsaci TaxID=166011 RepID=A0A915CM51_9BILA
MAALSDIKPPASKAKSFNGSAKEPVPTTYQASSSTPNSLACSAKKQILAQSNSSPVQIEEDHPVYQWFTIIEGSKVIDHVRTATSQFSFPTKLTPSSVNFMFGNVTPADIAKVHKVSQPKSILKRSFMTANRTYSMQNTASVKMDVKRRTIQASKSRINRLSRVASAPGTGGKFKAMESPKMRFIDLNSTVGGGSSGRDEFRKSQDRSLMSRDRSSVSRIYTPYAGPFRYKDTSKMRDDELKKYNLEKCLKRPENHEDSKNRIF